MLLKLFNTTIYHNTRYRNMNHDELIPLFSKPILKSKITNINVDLSTIKWAQNYQNWISESQDILSTEPFRIMLEEIGSKVADYFYGVMRVSPSTEIYITESWLNKTEKGQSHHRHWHPNSILSGVVTLAGDANSGQLKLITSQYDTLEFEVIDASVYNAKSWSFQSEPGNIIIFPSNVEHLVEPYYGEEPRITLSFNTFVKGKINSLPLTRLFV
jgi:uncharacterized protein (TIGR02466 family)